jgi:hypothetical protein
MEKEKVNLLSPGFEENSGTVRRATNPVTAPVAGVATPGIPGQPYPGVVLDAGTWAKDAVFPEKQVRNSDAPFI